MSQPNKNYLSSNKFVFTCQRIPELTNITTSAMIPDISAPVNVVPTPFGEIKQPGGSINYGNFGITINVMEDISIYQQVHDWIRSLTTAQDYKEPKTQTFENEICDGTLTLLSNNNNPIFNVVLHNLIPISLGNVDLTYTDDTKLEVDILFEYDYFIIEPVD